MQIDVPHQPEWRTLTWRVGPRLAIHPQLTTLLSRRVVHQSAYGCCTTEGIRPVAHLNHSGYPLYVVFRCYDATLQMKRNSQKPTQSRSAICQQNLVKLSWRKAPANKRVDLSI